MKPIQKCHKTAHRRMLLRMDYVNLGCCALAFVLYLNTFNAGFVYDDRRAILGNPDVMDSTQPWYQLLYNDFWGTPLVDSGSHGSYRPLCVLSYKINFIIGGFKPFGYHFVNVLLHCLATGLVVKLARHILPNGIGTLIAGLLFAAHPVHTEAVAGIVGRADLLACIFYISTLLSYIRHVQWREKCDSRHWLALCEAILYSSAALLCKETAISALVVCIVYDVLKGFNTFTRDKHQLRSIGILGIAILTTVHLRLSLPGPVTQFSTADNPTAKDTSLMTRFYTFSYLPAFNFKMLLYPHTLSFDWGMDSIPRITSLFDSRNMVSLMFYSAVIRIIFKSFSMLRHMSATTKTRTSTSSNNVHVSKIGRSMHNRKHVIHSTAAVNIDATSTNSQSNHSHENENNCPKCGLSSKYHQHNQQRHVNNANCRSSGTNAMANVTGFTAASLCTGGCSNSKIKKQVLSLSPLKKYIRNNNLYSSCSNCEYLKDNNNNNLIVYESSTSPLTTNSFYHSNSNDNNSSGISKLNGNCVKTLSSKFENFVDQIQSAEESSSIRRSTKLHMASATLLSITLLTLPFVPASNLFFYVGFVVAERILYLPSVGYCLLIGLGLGKLINFNVHLNKSKASKMKQQQKFDKQQRHQHHRNNDVRSIAIIVFLIILISGCSLKTILRSLDWHDEESLYRSAVKVNPPKAFGNLGSVLSSQGRFDEAEEALLAALKFRRNMADAHYNLGILYQNQQKYEDAVNSFQKAIHFRPSLALAYLNLGTSLVALGRCHEAASVLRDGAKLDGSGLRDRSSHDNARISSLLQLGGLYVDQGKLQRALAVYKEALHTLPNNYPPQGIFHRIGDTFMRLKKWSEAERFHRAALEAEPNHIPSHISYGTMLARNSSRSSEAEQYFKRAIRLAPLDSSVHHHYAEFLSSMSRHEEACESRMRAAELSPNDYQLATAVATALRMLDRLQEAERWYHQAVKLRPNDARAHTNLGAILHLLGQTQQATLSYKNALNLQPDDPTTLGNLKKLGVTVKS